MLTDWWPYVPALVLVVALLWVPGLVLQLALRERRALFVLAAPAYSMAVIGTAGVVLELAGIDFSLLGLGGFTLVAGTLAGAAGLVLRRFRGSTRVRDPLPDPVAGDDRGLFGLPSRVLHRGAAALGFVLGAVLLVRRLLFVVREPERFAQRYDNVFHLNAIRYAVETRTASSLTLGRVSDPDAGVAVYPAVWHALGSLAYPLSDQNVMVASNVVLLVVAGLVWPAACVFLTRVLLGPSAVALVVAGVASAGFALLPFSLLEFGPLFPNLLGLSAAPVALAYLAVLLGLDARGRTRGAPRAPAAVVTAGLCWLVVTGGVFLAHPNVVVLLMVLLIPMVLTAWARALRRVAASRRVLAAVVLVLALAAAVALWLHLWNTLTTDFVRFPHTTPAGAYGEAALYATNQRQQIPWLLVALTVGGVLTCFRRGVLRWLVLGQVLVVYLYGVAASAPVDDWREWAVGAWYQDSFRLGASLPVAAVPLVALGAAALAGQLQDRLRTAVAARGGSPRAHRAASGLVAVALVLAAVALTQVGTMRNTLLAANARYEWGNPDGILTEDEYALLRELPRLTDPDDVILVNPWNGGALAYAVAGSRVTQYHLGGPGRELAGILGGLPTAEPARACALASAESIDYVLDFGQQYLEIDTPKAEPYHPIDRLGEDLEPNLDLVAAEGDAELWEVTAC